MDLGLSVQSYAANIKAAPEADQTVHTFDGGSIAAADPNAPVSAETHAAVYNPGGDAYSINQIPANGATGPVIGGGTPMLPIDNTNAIGLVILVGFGALYFILKRKKK